MKKHVSDLQISASTVAALSLAVTTGCSRPAKENTTADASGPVKIAAGIDSI